MFALGRRKPGQHVDDGFAGGPVAELAERAVGLLALADAVKVKCGALRPAGVVDAVLQVSQPPLPQPL